MSKRIVLFVLFALLFAGNNMYAQTNTERAERLFLLLKAGQGDSIYAEMNGTVQAAITAPQISQIFGQLEGGYGAFQSKGEWKTMEVQGITVYYADVKFLQQSLRILFAFDADGKANTLRFVPTPESETSANDAAPANTAGDYIERAITIKSGAFDLPGLFTLPKGESRFPVAILVHGSGPHDKDETIGPNKPFKDMAMGLAERGITTIRYDKRTKVYGINSVPQGGEITLDAEVVDDVLAAVALAKQIKEIDPEYIYVLGHSLGAYAAPRIASKENSLAGIILLSGNARPLEDLIVEQMEYISSLNPNADVAQLEQIKKEAANVKQLGKTDVDTSVGLPFGAPAAYWKSLKEYNQLETVAQLTLPVLILQGERDYQVTMEDYYLWQKELAGKTNVHFISYPALNHLYLEGEGKSKPSEYSQKGNIPAYVFDDIASFIKGKRN